jgi:hypothetical protein
VNAGLATAGAEYPRRLPLARQKVDPGPAPGSAPAGAPAADEIASAADGDWVACAACRGFVADSRARFSVDGAHSHSFINPAGLIFRVSCFAAAPGVVPVGEESDDFTWFAGFAWRVALCRTCGEHLGWSYRRLRSEFVALIDDRVIERRTREGGSAPS